MQQSNIFQLGKEQTEEKSVQALLSSLFSTVLCQQQQRPVPGSIPAARALRKVCPEPRAWLGGAREGTSHCPCVSASPACRGRFSKHGRDWEMCRDSSEPPQPRSHPGSAPTGARELPDARSSSGSSPSPGCQGNAQNENLAATNDLF